MIFNDRSVKACSMLAVQANGARILTIEGLADNDGKLHPIPGRVLEQPRAAMRLLHAGVHHAELLVIERKSESFGGRGAQGNLRQPLQVHWIPEYREGDHGSGKDAGRGTREDVRG